MPATHVILKQVCRNSTPSEKRGNAQHASPVNYPPDTPPRSQLACSVLVFAHPRCCRSQPVGSINICPGSHCCITPGRPAAQRIPRSAPGGGITAAAASQCARLPWAAACATKAHAVASPMTPCRLPPPWPAGGSNPCCSRLSTCWHSSSSGMSATAVWAGGGVLDTQWSSTPRPSA